MNSKKQQQLYHESAYIEDTSDDELAPTMSVSKPIHRYNKPKRPQAKSLATQAEEEKEHAIALRAKKPAKKPFTLDPQKVFDAFHDASTKMEVLAVYLSQIEKTEAVTQWIQANDTNYAENLLQNISTIAALLNTTDETANTSSSDQTCSVSSAMSQYSQYFTLRAASKSIMLLAPVEIFKGLSNYRSKKVLGAVCQKGDPNPLKVAFPGWKACIAPHEKLLNSDVWTDEVIRFVDKCDYKLQKGSYDEHHRVLEGTTYASHVEPKLMLYFACMEYQKRTGKKYRLGQLFTLKRSTMEADIILSENPCQSCKLFQSMLEELTGLKFNIKLAPNLGRLKPKRDNRGCRYYGVDVSDCGSESEELQGRLEPRSGKFEIQIITKSSPKKKQTATKRSGMLSPPATPHKKVPALKISRRLCHDNAEWESEYVPPGRKLAKSPKRHHTQDDLEGLEQTQLRLEKRMKVSQTWLYRN